MTIFEYSQRSYSRRAFVKGGGALVVAFGSPLVSLRMAAGETVPFPLRMSDQLDPRLRIGQDGKVTVFMVRVDIGDKSNNRVRSNRCGRARCGLRRDPCDDRPYGQGRSDEGSSICKRRPAERRQGCGTQPRKQGACR